jgi:hypothetical protein
LARPKKGVGFPRCKNLQLARAVNNLDTSEFDPQANLGKDPFSEAVCGISVSQLSDIVSFQLSEN